MILKRLGRRTDAHGRPVVTYGYRFEHHHREYKRFFKSRELAVEAEKRLKAQLRLQAWEGEFGPLRPRLTLWADAVRQYAEAKADKASLPDDVRRLTWWGTFLEGQGAHHLQELTPELLDKGKAALKADSHRPASIVQYLAVVRALCRLAVRRWHLLKANPTDAVDWPKVERREIRVPTMAEWHRLLSVADPILRALIWTLSYTGLRKMAGLQLTAEDLRERPGWIKGRDQKGKKPIWLPVVPEFKAVLDQLGVAAGRFFREANGRPMTRFPRERWEAARKAAGISWCRVHDLRHTTGTLLAELGVPQRIIQEWLGHSVGWLTERYTHPGEAGFVQAGRKLARRFQSAKKPSTIPTKSVK